MALRSFFNKFFYLKKEGPLVSIVIPVYNGSNYLKEAIESALSQSYSQIEIIIVNDGSTDNGKTRKIALEYSDKVHYFEKSNGGVGSALNYGIKKSNGQYISWLSHDDLYVKNKIKAQVKTLKKYGPKTILYSDFAIFTENKKSNLTYHRLPRVSPHNFRYWITLNNAIHGCSLLIPREIFTHYKFDENLRTTQDYDLWFRLAQKYDFIHIPKVLVHGRSHGGQGTIAMSSIAQEECNSVLISFMHQLTKEEIISGSSSSLKEGYLKLAQSCYLRGFVEAGDEAIKLADKHND